MGRLLEPKSLRLQYAIIMPVKSHCIPAWATEKDSLKRKQKVEYADLELKMIRLVTVAHTCNPSTLGG